QEHSAVRHEPSVMQDNVSERKKVGESYGYYIEFRGVRHLYWLNTELSNLDLLTILGSGEESAIMLAAIKDGSIFLRDSICDVFIRRIYRFVRQYSNKSCNPSTQELRAFVYHILHEYPSLAKELCSGCKGKLYRRMSNVKHYDTRDKFIDGKELKRRKVETEPEVTLTDEQCKERLTTLYSLSKGTAGYVSSVSETRLYRTRICRSSGPTSTFSQFPILSRDPQIIIDDFLFSKKINANFEEIFEEIGTRAVECYNDFFSDTFVDDLYKQFDNKHLVALFTIIKLLNTRRSHLRGEKIFQAYYSSSSSDEVVQQRAADKHPVIFLVGHEINFRVAIEAHDISAGKSFPNALLLLLSLYYQFNLEFPIDAKDMFSFIELSLGIKSSVTSQKAKELYSKIAAK
ncbi:hypothetical protein PFISCL1PPCAC_2918, partial [Pristionchus fissidentatus]